MCYGVKVVLVRSQIVGLIRRTNDDGNKLLMTINTSSCKLQKRNRYDYINSVVATHLRNEPAPSILPQEELFVPDKIAA